MKVHIARWGNSLAVRIPKQAANSANLQEGDTVELSLGKDAIVIQKASSTLNELVAKITPENLHRETKWGWTRGREFC